MQGHEGWIHDGVGHPTTPFAKDWAGWYLSVYPDAREASGIFKGTARKGSGRRGTPGQAVDEQRSRKMAASRARTTLRRYCTANRLNRLGTVTYGGEGCHDPRRLREDMAGFFIGLRRLLGGEPFPYAWVPEWHHKDHGLHAHFAFARYVKRSLIEDAWGRGFVHIKLIGDLPVGSTAVDEARVAARYLAKYVGKTFDEAGITGLHRYEVGQNFQPKRLRVYGRTMGEALSEACRIMGGAPVEVSISKDWGDWSGPQAMVATWAS